MAGTPDRVPAVSPMTGQSCLAMLAVRANGRGIVAALPTIRRDRGLDAGGVGWAVNCYLIACVILGGRAADRAGPRRAAAFGLLTFAAASALIAAASAPA